MAKPGRIDISDLDDTTIKKLGLKKPPTTSPIEMRLIGLGKVLSALTGLTNREAIWILRQCIHYIEGSRGRVKPG